jgi:hypothetical protein
MNQFPQRLFVGSERVRCVEASQTKPAQRAAPRVIERKRIHKWSFAISAKVFRDQRLRLA